MQDLLKALLAAVLANPAQALTIIEDIIALIKANPDLMAALIAFLKKQAGA